MSDTETRLRAMIADHLGIAPEKITDDAAFYADLGCDDLDKLELTMLAEEHFLIEISDDESNRAIGEFGTFAKLLALVDEKLGAKVGA